VTVDVPMEDGYEGDLARRHLSFYERRVFPWLNDKLGADPQLIQTRAEALASARGRVVEIGFGSGPNLIHYPMTVRRIVGVEPNDGMCDRAAPQIRLSRIPVDLIVAEAEFLPFADCSFDTAVSTLTLCSVFDPAQALNELRRVLRDDGGLIVIEHGLSPDATIARWQNRLNGLQKVVACGCHLNRPIGDLVEKSGFRFEFVRTFYARKAPRTHGCVTTGAALKA
jgi:ubiquinone/menaquinone biosynthesis C-methylase UbiE